ncbi:MAG: DUF2284 domain-containing protein [Clostridiales bacterium]|nr:DUF2284 domain-containing protein [Clostridiales bacterium]
MDELVKQALDFGFSHAAMLDAGTLTLRTEVRDMCAAGKCKSYNKRWVCPPACGTLEEIAAKIAEYKTGLIVQTTADLEDEFDYDSMREAAALQKERLNGFRKVLAGQWPRLTPLSGGSCNLCKECTWPDNPCRRPEDSFMSMEAAGLVVSDVCQSNGIPYYYGKGTLTYTSCFLLE